MRDIDKEMERFLATKVKPCRVCGNKIRPAKRLERDMQASYYCPELSCAYCGHSAGAFWPDGCQACLDAWDAMN